MGEFGEKKALVIIGGGGSGLAAAVAAAEAGWQDIVVLEKRARSGGTSAMASGPFGAESPAQKRQGILASKDDLFQRALAWSHLRADALILRAFINKSGDTIRWLEEKGIFFYCVPHSPTDDPLTWHVSRGDGAEIMDVLARECLRLSVKIELQTGAKQFVKDNSGRLTGVLAEREGQSLTFPASAAIIATGGFAGNRELLRKYCPDFRENLRLSGAANEGEGLKMALEAGAATRGLGLLMSAGPVSGGFFELGEGADKVKLSLTFVSGEPAAIWVNQKGRRFVAETAVFNYYESINALLQQPGCQSFALLDSRMIESIARTGLSNVPAGYGYGPRQRSPLPGGLAEALRGLADRDFLKVSDSWEAVASWIGCPARPLKTTVEEYNADCGRGYDGPLGKPRQYLLPLEKAPFYAIRCGASMLNTMGGIRVDERMQVIDLTGEPIPGLFAAGVDTGGWTAETYCADLPGTAFGYALNSGRIAGEEAVRYLGIS
jgi:fumarate reductase flavoprotein subunit